MAKISAIVNNFYKLQKLITSTNFMEKDSSSRVFTQLWKQSNRALSESEETFENDNQSECNEESNNDDETRVTKKARHTIEAILIK